MKTLWYLSEAACHRFNGAGLGTARKRFLSSAISCGFRFGFNGAGLGTARKREGDRKRVQCWPLQVYFNGAGLGTARKPPAAVEDFKNSLRVGFNGAGLGTARKPAWAATPPTRRPVDVELQWSRAGNSPETPRLRRWKTSSRNTIGTSMEPGWEQPGNLVYLIRRRCLRPNSYFNGAGLGTARKQTLATAAENSLVLPGLQWSRAGNSPETYGGMHLQRRTSGIAASMEPGWEQPGNQGHQPFGGTLMALQWSRAGNSPETLRQSRSNSARMKASMEPGWEQPGNLRRTGCHRRLCCSFNGAGLGTARKLFALGLSTKGMPSFNGAGLGTARKPAQVRLDLGVHPASMEPGWEQPGNVR